ncbi:MAG: futalosine hydrolase [Sphingobacteriaceae bacterium]|nr:futalosine hydrolase [Sphingobacteriaceae bacterium]
MKILLVCATPLESELIVSHFNIGLNHSSSLFHSSQSPVSLLITGVGMVNTAFSLGKFLNDSYSYVINFGICGAFHREIHIGEVLNIKTDTISEMGAEDNLEFIPYDALNLTGTNRYFNNTELKVKSLENVKSASAVTVNKIHGNKQSIDKLLKLYSPDAESMEGAAFFRAMQDINIPYFQIRAVSNYVEKRNKSNWDIPKAINSVTQKIIELTNELLSFH